MVSTYSALINLSLLSEWVPVLTEEQSELSNIKEDTIPQEQNQIGLIGKTAGVLGKLIGSFDPRFGDRKVSLVLRVDEGDHAEVQMLDYIKPTFDFIEFFCTIENHNNLFVLKSLVVR